MRSMMKGKLGGGLLMGGLTVADGLWTFSDRRKNNPNENVMTSAAYAAGTMALWHFAPQLMFMHMGAGIAKDMGAAYQKMSKQQQGELINRSTANFGRGFQDSEMGYTMRQRGMNAIQQSRLNARSALGGEARGLHR